MKWVRQKRLFLAVEPIKQTRLHYSILVMKWVRQKRLFLAVEPIKQTRLHYSILVMKWVRQKRLFLAVEPTKQTRLHAPTHHPERKKQTHPQHKTQLPTDFAQTCTLVMKCECGRNSCQRIKRMLNTVAAWWRGWGRAGGVSCLCTLPVMSQSLLCKQSNKDQRNAHWKPMLAITMQIINISDGVWESDHHKFSMQHIFSDYSWSNSSVNIDQDAVTGVLACCTGLVMKTVIKCLRPDKAKDQFQFFPDNTTADLSVPVVPSGSQHALRLLCTWKTSCPPFKKPRRPHSR